MDFLKWDIEYSRVRQPKGSSHVESQQWLSAQGHVPIHQGSWNQRVVPVWDGTPGGGHHTLFNRDSGAGHLMVVSPHLLTITLNDQVLVGRHLSLDMAELTTATVRALGLPVAQGTATTGTTTTRLVDQDQQWGYGLLRGLTVAGDGWHEPSHAVDVMCDVNGRVAVLRQEAPIDFRATTGSTATGRAVTAWQGWIDDSQIGAGQVTVRWVADEDRDGYGRFELVNRLRPEAPSLRPSNRTDRNFLARMGLWHAEEIPAALSPDEMQVRILSGRASGQSRTITRVGEHSVEWDAGSPISNLVVGDRYRILKTTDEEAEAEIRWVFIEH